MAVPVAVPKQADCGNSHNFLLIHYSFKSQGMNIMNHWRVRSTSRAATLFILTITSAMSFATSQIWSGNSGVGLGAAAARFNIHAGVASSTSTQTLLSVYTSTDCTNLVARIPATGEYTFHAPSTIQVSATSVYNLINNQGTSPSTINSIQIEPFNNTDPLFIEQPACFAVNCSVATQQFWMS